VSKCHTGMYAAKEEQRRKNNSMGEGL